MPADAARLRRRRELLLGFLPSLAHNQAQLLSEFGLIEYENRFIQRLVNGYGTSRLGSILDDLELLLTDSIPSLEQFESLFGYLELVIEIL